MKYDQHQMLKMTSGKRKRKYSAMTMPLISKNGAVIYGSERENDIESLTSQGGILHKNDDKKKLGKKEDPMDMSPAPKG